MSGGSPTAYLLWSILATLFYAFHLFHLWSYDRFQCLKWNQSGRQPGAFKRFMSYTYLATLSCLVCFSVAFTYLKFQEGFITLPNGQITPTPLESYSRQNKKWVLPLFLVFSVGWSCELVTHLEGKSAQLCRSTMLIAPRRAEFTFWLFLHNQGPTTRLWFESGEFKFWLGGTFLALLGMPLTTFVSRRQLDTCLAWTLFVGSSASTATSLAFLYVLSRFPGFIRRVKDDSAAPAIVLRLVFFYQLNVGRVIYRFLFSLPLLVLSLDGVQGNHPINRSTFWPDFLLMIGGIGAFVSSAITLLVFFPRSLTQELGYTIVGIAKTPLTASIDLHRPPGHFNTCPPSPKDQIMNILRPSSEHRLSEYGHDASPEYQLEDPSNAPRPNSLESNFQMPPEAETSSAESYVFDRHSRSLVQSRSERHGTALHPYVRVFRSPIDIADVEALDDLPEW